MKTLSMAAVFSMALAMASTATPASAEVTGANIPLDQARTEIHVDNLNPKASDENPGSDEAPLKTVGRAISLAVENNKKGQGTKVLIHAGMYRDSISLVPNGKETPAPIIIEAAGKGGAIISGSDVWTDWTRQKDTPVYVHPWPMKWGLSPYPAGWEPSVVLWPITRHREMIFLDGHLLRQVLSPMELTDGSFYVCAEKQMAYIWPPKETDMKAAVVEVAVRPRPFWALGKQNVAVRGLVFQHAANTYDESAVGFANCHDVLVEDCAVQWNSGQGLGFAPCDNVTARRLKINNNGAGGGGGWKVSNILWEDTEQAGNNWRGHWGKFHDWAPAGCKFMLIRDGLFRRTTSAANFCRGFWFDTDCVDVVLAEANLCNNLVDGLFLEADQGPITVRSCRVASNALGGISSTNSSHITLERNIIWGNGNHQVWAGGNETRTEEDHVAKKPMLLKVEHWTLMDNIIAASRGDQSVLDFVGWKHFVTTLAAQGNWYFNPDKTMAFRLSGADSNLALWQSKTGQDANSVFADPQSQNSFKEAAAQMGSGPYRPPEIRWLMPSRGETPEEPSDKNSVAIAPDAGAFFRPGDVVVRTAQDLRVFRQEHQAAQWAASGPVCLGADRTVWTASAEANCVVLREYYSPSKHTQFASEPIEGLLEVHKVLRLDQQLFVIFTVKYEEKTKDGLLSAAAIQVMTYSLGEKKFGVPFGLKDHSGQPELCVGKQFQLDNGKPLPVKREGSPSIGVFEATFLGKSCLCISSQSTIYFYRVGQIPAPLAGLFALEDVPEYGMRTGEITAGESGHGNNWGLAPISDHELLVVDMALPGKVTVVDVDDPDKSRPLTKQIDPSVGGWGGFRAICLRKNDLLVANVQDKTQKIYRIDRATGQVKDTFAQGVGGLEMIAIPRDANASSALILRVAWPRLYSGVAMVLGAKEHRHPVPRSGMRALLASALSAIN